MSEQAEEVTEVEEIAEDAAEYAEYEEANSETEDQAAESTETGEDEPGAADTSDGSRNKRSARKRINDLTAAWRKEKAEKQEILARLERLEQAHKEAEPDPNPRPDPEDFETTEEYEDALIDWKLEKRDATKATGNTKAEQQTETDAPDLPEDFLTSLRAARETYEDYDAVVFDPSLMISEDMFAAIQTLERGPDVAYYLGQNPELAARISELPPARQAAEIGRIEATMPESFETTTTSQAPRPPSTPPSGRGSGVDPNSMTADEWQRWRNKQVAGRS